MMMIQNAEIRDTELQDADKEKTFAPATWSAFTRGPGRVWLPILGLIVLTAGVTLVVWMLSPEKQHLLFDLALAVPAVVVALWLLRYGVSMNAMKPHAELRSLTYGTATAGAILGLLLFTLHGRTVGWTQVPALMVGYALIMTVGALIGGLLGAFCYWPSHIAAGVLRLSLRWEAIVTGGLTGLAMAMLLMLAPDARFGVQAAAVALGALCAYRSALLHERLPATRGRR